MQGRTYGQHAKLSERVEGLWGSAHIQTAPNVTYRTIVPRKAERVTEDEKGHKLRKTEIVNETVINKVNLDSSDIRVDLDLTHRQKGLLWYSTYRVGFHSVYRVTNPLARPQQFLMSFSFPSKNALYDNFVLTVNGKAVDIKDFTLGEVAVPFPLEPKGTATIEIGYTSQGLDKWFYKFGEGVNRVKNFSLAMKTNFKDIDFPQDTVSPTEKTPFDSGWDYIRLPDRHGHAEQAESRPPGKPDQFFCPGIAPVLLFRRIYDHHNQGYQYPPHELRLSRSLFFRVPSALFLYRGPSAHRARVPALGDCFNVPRNFVHADRRRGPPCNS
jgi:hypothetical protein